MEARQESHVDRTSEQNNISPPTLKDVERVFQSRRDNRGQESGEFWEVIRRFRPEPDTSPEQTIEDYKLPRMETREQYLEGMVLSLQLSCLGMEWGPVEQDKVLSFTLHMFAVTSGVASGADDYTSLYEKLVEQARHDGLLPWPGATQWPTAVSSPKLHTPPNHGHAPSVNSEDTQDQISTNASTTGAQNTASWNDIEPDGLTSDHREPSLTWEEYINQDSK